MKHFFTIATLLTSVSAFAQLPYNPDADNNGTIGASDLTSLLSVYGNGFSNGVLGEGSAMATLDMPFGVDYPYYSYNFSSSSSSFVVDLTLIPEEDFVNGYPTVQLNLYSGFNGLTITFIVPSYFPSCTQNGFALDTGASESLICLKPSYITLNPDSPYVIAELPGTTFQTVVFWNGVWAHQPVGGLF